jgi:peptide chain release factor
MIKAMIDFGITGEKQDALKHTMNRLGIRESDIEEKFIRSGGKGGQNVNKVATCVYLKHIPSGIEVKMQQERSQVLNRFFARRLLCEKYETMILKQKTERQKEIEKIRRQKRKRNKRAKEKILRDKRHISQKKEMRKSPLF